MYRMHKHIVIAFLLVLFGCGGTDISRVNSITGDDYKGNKLFFAWAANVSKDLSNGLSAQTRFDVNNMHNIFSKEWGGGYKSKTMIDNQEAKGANILATIKGATTQYSLDKDSMYFQYSAGHGTPTGLLEDVIGASQPSYKEISYTDIAKAVLSLPSREVIIMTMACGSGGLIEAFKKEEALLKKWQDEGRSFFIMTSSSPMVMTSSGEAGPADNKNYNNLPGTSGSPFGQHLYEGLKGAADGYGTLGKKDGKITLAEIRDYVTDAVKKDNREMPKFFRSQDGSWQTSATEKELQVPQFFGFNYENLHMTGLDHKSAPSDSNISAIERYRLKQYANQIDATKAQMKVALDKIIQSSKDLEVYEKKTFDFKKMNDLYDKIFQKENELQKLECQSETTAEGLKNCTMQSAQSIAKIRKELEDLNAQLNKANDPEEKLKKLSPEERPKYLELTTLSDQLGENYSKLVQQLQQDYLNLHNKILSLLKQGMQ